MKEHPVAIAAKRAGLDPNMILMRGLTPFWYRSFVLNDDGKRQRVDYKLQTVVKLWPNPILGIGIWLLWRKDERRWWAQ